MFLRLIYLMTGLLFIFSSNNLDGKRVNENYFDGFQ